MEEKKLLRILLVEDSDNDAQLLLREVRRAGYQIEYTRVETAEALIIPCPISMHRTHWRS